MTVQTWVINRLNEGPWAATAIGPHGVRVVRPHRSEVVAYCPDSGSTPFTGRDLDQALAEVPDADALVMVRRNLAAGAFLDAEQSGLLVATYGAFERSLNLQDITRFEHPDETYLRSRLHRARHVVEVTRIGMRAWHVARAGRLRPLTIVTHDRYEFTDDEMWSLIETHPGLDVDALVITNPNARGFGSRVAGSAQGLGVVISTLDDFLAQLGQPWT